jgi:hypothetical protein
MPGIYNISIKDGIITKTINMLNPYARKLKQKLQDTDEFTKYSQILNECYRMPLIGKNICKCNNIDDDGTYQSKFIEGINLMDLLPSSHTLCLKANYKSNNITIDKQTTFNILVKLFELEQNMILYSKNGNLTGDWFLHNLIYSPKDNMIYNVDLEGFYTYRKNEVYCNMLYLIPNQFNILKKVLCRNVGLHLFSIILWPPVQHLFSEIIGKIQKDISLIHGMSINMGNMHQFIQKTYELDVRCHKPYLIDKEEFFKKFEPKIQLLQFVIETPNFDHQNVSQSAVQLKNKYRAMIKPQLNEYIRDIIIHVSDNETEAYNIVDYVKQLLLEGKYIIDTPQYTPSLYDFFIHIISDLNVVVLRNFMNLKNNFPKYPDDVDILTDDYDKIFNKIKPYLLQIDNPNVGHILKYNNQLIKLDIRVIGDNYYDINWEKDILMSKFKFKDYYIPTKEYYLYSILYHCLVHKDTISEKYKNLISDNFNTLDKNLLQIKMNEYLLEKKYSIVKPNDKNCQFNYKGDFMLFIIRKNGLERHKCIKNYVENILITNNYKIKEQGLIQINKEKMLKSFYNQKQFQDAINNANDNMCYYFITNYTNYKLDSTKIKNNVRNKYPNPENIHWNYFHSSDSSQDAEREIKILKKVTLTTFKNIGTYYNQKEI